MSQWLEQLSTLQVLGLVAGVLLGGSVLAALLGAVLVRLGMKRPWVLQRASRLAYRVLELVKRPLTIVVLDEVAAVMRTGRYTQNISDALLENHDELKALVAEKVAADPNARLVRKVPGYDTVVSEVTETVLRVVVDMLSDPRMDELVADLLRNNLDQITDAVRKRDHEALGEPAPPDPVPADAPVDRARRE
ncbi:hypothetical protein [Nocardioides acrostichi]|uniref:Uncharacterized protein n=1 Tax=Nocardioides acrostichi TaxID=2784339 RepID=A0A930Y7M3_9ACTN|nr:hypothetical protein [Nocardioides acrostichi]MBF4163580.1 hypothetical protein [Nocardioides acrostichi]